MGFSIDNSLCSFESSASDLLTNLSISATMLFVRAASFCFAALTFGLVVSANPVPEAKKRAVSAETIVTNLQTSVASITSQLRKNM